jgi:hypothetical protein
LKACSTTSITSGILIRVLMALLSNNNVGIIQ